MCYIIFEVQHLVYLNTTSMLQPCIFSCNQAALWMVQSVCPSVRQPVCLSATPFHYVPVIVSSWNFQKLLSLTEVMSMRKVKVGGQRSRSQRSWPHLAVSGLYLQFEFAYGGNEMMHIAWCCLEEVPYCFSRSFVKFQGQAGQKIEDVDPNWAFPDCNFSLNSPMLMEWCIKLEVT